MADQAPTKTQRHPSIAGARAYFDLMKPRVMSLVVFTALVGMVCAPGDVNPLLGAVSILAIAMGAGGAGSLNMGIDADIDKVMKRTRMRPVPAGLVERSEAYGMGLVMAFVSVTLLFLSAGVVAALALAFTIFFYAVPYSIWLKRATPQNIVIGGLAGALPPLVAWLAATHDPTDLLRLNPWLPVAIIFLWTPPHSWALALYKAGDYAAAGVPMMPVAKGAKSTRLQILLYSLALVPVALVPCFTGLGGYVYGVVASVSGAIFLALAFKVYRSTAGDTDGRVEGRALYQDSAITNRPARNLFAFSLIYLTALFAALLIEHSIGQYLPFLGVGG